MLVLVGYKAPLKYLLTSVLIAAVLCFGFVAILSSSLNGLGSIDRATIIEGNETREVQLPYFWRETVHEVRSTLFQITYDSSDFGSSLDDVYLFLPYFEQRVYLSVNANRVPSNELEKAHYSPLTYSYALTQIPRTFLKSGSNSIQLRVETGPGLLGSVPPLFIGSLSQLQLPYSLFRFSTYEFRMIIMGAELLLLFFCVITFVKRPSDSLPGWIGGATFGSILASMPILTDLFPSLSVFTTASILLLPICGISIVGFAITFAKLPFQQIILPIAVLFIGLPVLFVETNLFISADIYRYVTMPTMIVTLGGGSALVMLTAIREQSNQASPIVISLAVLAMAIGYDLSARFGALPTGIPISVFARAFVILSVVVYMMRRATSDAEALDTSAQVLQDRLAEREKTLSEIFSSQQVTLEKYAKSEERKRITAELHDGVAGHLITILALADSGRDQQEPIRKTTRVALEELRTVIDMLVVSNTNLEFTLASFRERCLEPIEKSGVIVTFDITGVSNNVDLSPTESLNVFRILQEATTNAMKHGSPKELFVSAKADAGRVKLTVCNRGGKPLNGYQSGYGLRSMTDRAQSVREGEIKLESTTSGADLTFTFSV